MMSGISTVCLTICAMVTCAQASDQGAQRYNEGNALYRQGRYIDAIQRYEAALATGVQNAGVYYNLGNAHFKNGALGRALLNYEKARRLDPGDPDVLENIAFANEATVDRFDLEPANAVTRFLSSVYRMVSPDGLTLWVSFFFLLVCLGVGGKIFVDAHRLRWLALSAIAVFGCLICGALLTAKIGDLQTEEGIILAVETTGRSGPGEDYLQVFALHEGTKVIVERKEGRWGLVRLPNGIGGWIVLDGVGMI